MLRKRHGTQAANLQQKAHEATEQVSMHRIQDIESTGLWSHLQTGQHQTTGCSFGTYHKTDITTCMQCTGPVTTFALGSSTYKKGSFDKLRSS